MVLPRVALIAAVAAAAVSCSLAFSMSGYEGVRSDGGPHEAAAAVDAGPDAAPEASVYCAGNNCVVGSGFCCLDLCTAGAGTCHPLSRACSGCEVELGCDDALDCVGSGPTGVCCVALDATGKPTRGACQTLKDCQESPHLILCDPVQSAPCPNGASCDAVDGGRFGTGRICSGA